MASLAAGITGEAWQQQLLLLLAKECWIVDRGAPEYHGHDGLPGREIAEVIEGAEHSVWRLRAIVSALRAGGLDLAKIQTFLAIWSELEYSEYEHDHVLYLEP